MTITTNELAALLAETTQGPWRVEDWREEKRKNPHWRQPSFENGGFMVFADDCDSHPVADCSCNHTCRPDLGLDDGLECGANARLIALAPDLAAELIASRAREKALVEALKRIAAEDDTGPLLYETRDYGPAQVIGGSAGRFSDIARAAIKENQHG